MDVPTTVRTALADRAVDGAVCLDAGCGYGNTTAGLLENGASHVYAVTDDADHARAVRRRCAGESGRTTVLRGDARTLPLPDDAVDVVTAHALCTLLSPAALDGFVSEVTRVATPGCHLVVDDYDPLPAASAVSDLFALGNAASELARGRPEQTFYPASCLRRLFVGAGWTFDRESTLLDPVPWTATHLRAHADVARERAAALPEGVGTEVVESVDALVESIGEESAGRMYSLAFRRSR